MEANPRQNLTKSSLENKLYCMFLKYWLNSLQLLIRKDAILDLEVGVGEV